MIENKYREIDNYWMKTKQKKSSAEKFALKVSHILNSHEWKDRDIFNIFRKIRMFIYYYVAMLCEQIEKYQKKKRLSRLLKFQKNEIAVDDNDLLKGKEKIRCYGSDFTYSVVTTKKYLKNIEVIFGDAHLEALDELACFCNLKKVTGKIYFRGKEFESLVEMKEKK